MEYTIPKANVQSFRAEIDKINRKLDKKGIEGRITATITDIKTVDVLLPSMRKAKREVCTIEVDSPRPKLPGSWRLIGTLDHTSANKAIVRGIPGETIPVEYREVDSGRCDHCHTDRRRSDTFLIQSGETNEIKVVGRQCIADFLGINVDSALFVYDLYYQIAKLCSDAEESASERFPHPVLEVEIIDYLAFASLVIRQEGYVPRSNFGENSADRIWEYYHRGVPAVKGVSVLEETQETAHDIETANATLAWIRESKETNDYMYNLRTIAEAGLVTYKTIGFVTSAVPSYLRFVGREVERKAKEKREANVESKYVGSVKDKLTADVTITGIKAIETNYGTMHIVTMLDDTGNVLVWFASNYPRFSNVEEYQASMVNIGDHATVKGTVKGHSEFRGTKQTNLTRCKLSKIGE